MLTTPNILAAYLYLHQHTPMPAQVLDDDGEHDVVADNAAIVAWSEGSDTFEIDTVRLARFIERTATLLSELQTLVLEDTPAAPQYMTLFYNAAKDTFDHDKALLRTYFAWLYTVLFGRAEGPRWGEFVDIYGVEPFVALVETRFHNLIH
jgi:lysyl-tRNA synthetase class I